MSHNSTSVRCAIVLAAGSGKRLEPFIYRLRGDALPKQYVNFFGTRSMLEQTYNRAEKIISCERLFTVVGKDHLAFAEPRRQLSGRAPDTVVVQPANKDTGPGLLLPLMHVYKRYADATVVVFPSDHFIAEEDLFLRHVEAACRVVERHPSCLVLLGMEPDEPEPEYGYIVPGEDLNGPGSAELHKVTRFVEKPNTRIARELITAGALWNTMVMVFKAEMLLTLVRDIDPKLFDSFERICEAIGTLDEARVVERFYRQLPAVNFSQGLLEPFAADQPSSLLVLRVRGVFWSDWGSEQRIVSVLKKRAHVGSSHESFYSGDHKLNERLAQIYELYNRGETRKNEIPQPVAVDRFENDRELSCSRDHKQRRL